MKNVQRATALARRCAGTISNISVVIGPVGRNSRNIESPSAVNVSPVPGASTATTHTGTARIIDTAISQT